jgi:hypothetical protein
VLYLSCMSHKLTLEMCLQQWQTTVMTPYSNREENLEKSVHSHGALTFKQNEIWASENSEKRLEITGRTSLEIRQRLLIIHKFRHRIK